MQINGILTNRIIPFECGDKKLVLLFSFFLHKAPTIESATAMIIDDSKLANNWDSFIFDEQLDCSEFISDYCGLQQYLEKGSLHGEAAINRKSRRFICKRKGKNGGTAEPDYTCFLRHMRNSIAHSNVFMLDGGHRKYILFDDFNNSGNQSARILLSRSDLEKLRQKLTR